MNIVLIGYRGSGKTSVGRLAAARLGRGFVDTDEMIVAEAGRSIREIFEEPGEGGFRKLEARIVLEAAGLENRVISLGGGALGREENRLALKKGDNRIYYLRCEAAELFRRIQGDAGTAAQRPALTRLGGSVEEIEHLLAEREPVYRQMMDVELDVTRLTAEQAAKRIAELYLGGADGR